MQAFNWCIFLTLLILLLPNVYYNYWHNALACFAIGFALRGQIPLLFTDKEK